MTIAVLGYGHQGEAQALNLRDAGRRVIVGARPGHAGAARAAAAGFEVVPLEEAVARAGHLAMMLPDEVVPELWPALSRRADPSAVLVFAHGYALLYSTLAFAPSQPVVLVSPTSPGRVLRERVASGAQVPAYIAVHRDGGADAWAIARRYAAWIGCGPLWPTTVAEETEVDLFGEQAVLCGGMNALVTAAWETLVERGYAPEIAYLEVVHQLKYLADLLHERGVAGMRDGISSTALFGDLTRGPRVVGAPAREEMRALLEEIRSGAFAREWAAEVAAGRPHIARRLEEGRLHPIEQARRRALGLDPDPPR